MPCSSPPNYELRRLVALTTLFVLVYSVWRLAGTVDSALRPPAHLAGPSSGSTPTGPPSPSPSPSGSLIGTVVPPPACSKGDDPADQARPADWARTLLDTRFSLPASYVPPNLVPVSDAGFTHDAGLFVRTLAIGDLKALRQAATAAGNPVDIVAAYRSYDEQASLFKRRKESLGLEEAERKTARAGHSEHQLGTAIDFKTAGATDVSSAWDSSPAGAWMLQNAWTFGFVQSYPRGKSPVTCYAYEPWHYRYFGRDVAATILASGLTVREYLWNQGHGG